MSLNARQLAAFTDTCDLYKPLNETAITTDANGVVSYGQNAVAGTATHTAVAFHLVPSREGSHPMIQGRSNHDILDTTDRAKFHIDQAIGDGWALKLTTSGHPEQNTWYTVQGEARTNSWRANEREVLIKRTTKPPGVA